MSDFNLTNCRYKHRIFNRNIKSWNNFFKTFKLKKTMNVVDVGGRDGAMLIGLFNNGLLNKGLIIDNEIDFIQKEYLDFYKKNDEWYKNKNINRINSNILDDNCSEPYDLLIKSYCQAGIEEVLSVFKEKPKYMILSHENDISNLKQYNSIFKFSNWTRKKDQKEYEKFSKKYQEHSVTYHYHFLEKKHE